MLPAVGAAGALALAPDARYERAAQAAVPNAAALGATFPGELQNQGAAPTAGTGAPAAGRLRAGSAPVRRHSPGGTGVLTPAGATPGTSQTGAGAAPPTSSGGGGQSTPPVSVGSTEVPAVEVPVPPGVPPVKAPPVKAPPVEVPSVEVPAVKVPPVSTPSVTTPQVSAGAVTVPSVTVPSVTVQVPGTPGIKVP